MIKKIHDIIEYAKSLGFIEYKIDEAYCKHNLYYKFPGMPDESWVLSLYDDKTCLDIVGHVTVNKDLVETDEAKSYTEYQSWKFHLKRLAQKCRKYVLMAKQYKEIKRLNAIKGDF